MGRAGTWMPCAFVLLPLLCLLLAGLAGGEEAGDTRVLRIATSGDYAPFSLEGNVVRAPRSSSALQARGFDIEIARAYAKARGLEIQWQRFRWPDLLAALEAGAFDLAMSGITVRPERSVAGLFSIPVATTGAVALVHIESPHRQVDHLDREGLRIAVNAGGHLERVTRARFARATIIAVPDNRAVPRMIALGTADAIITDTLEAPHWRIANPGLRALPPFTRDHKAYLAPPTQAALIADLDAWLMASERDGSLAKLRLTFMGTSGEGMSTAAPLAALLASLDERLSLMPAVAAHKRAKGLPIEVPAREARVVEAALASVARAADAAGIAAPPAAPVRALFRAQIEAAKDIQRRGAGPESAAPPPFDLDGELRPALIRLGDRIARLLVHLPSETIEDDALRARTEAALARHRLSPERLQTLVRALRDLASVPREAANVETQ